MFFSFHCGLLCFFFFFFCGVFSVRSVIFEAVSLFPKRILFIYGVRFSIKYLNRCVLCYHFVCSDRNVDSRSFLRGIDVNRLRTAVDGEEENGVSSPNSTVSSISGKRSEREAVGDEAEAERTSCSRGSDDEDGGDGDGDASRKKLRLSKEQSLVLEETFKEHNTLNPVSGNPVISYDSSLHVALMISGNSVIIWV